jgi:hypothetical protein
MTHVKQSYKMQYFLFGKYYYLQMHRHQGYLGIVGSTPSPLVVLGDDPYIDMVTKSLINLFECYNEQSHEYGKPNNMLSVKLHTCLWFVPGP